MNPRQDDMSFFKVVGRPLLVGWIGGVIACFLLLLMTAAVMASTTFPTKLVTPITVAVSALGALVGGWIAARLSCKRGLLYGAGCGLLLFLLVATAGMIATQELRGSLLLIKLAVMVAGGALGGVLGVNTKRRR